MYHFYARQQSVLRVIGVCLSVKLLHCIKTMQAKIVKFLLWAAGPPRTVVSCDKI